MNAPAANQSGNAAAHEAGFCERRLLTQVSRTFALTIPELPEALRGVVANAYLLCRAADTIEDDSGLDPAQKRIYGDELVQVVSGRAGAERLARDIGPLLAASTPPAEHELMRYLPEVVARLRDFLPEQRAAIERCLGVMCGGMHRFQPEAGLRGLATQRDLDRYCYHVGGVVGEMLTELFCAYSPEIARRRDELMRRAVSFGQGLQMTNILKDQWEDRVRGVCWLPREVLQAHGLRAEELSPGRGGAAYIAAMDELIGVAHAHLLNALDYTLLIPAQEPGIRRFCYWSVHLAVATLRNLHRNLGFSAGAEIKVSRGAVAKLVLLTKMAGSGDGLLRTLLEHTGRGLPRRALAEAWNASFSGQH